MPNNKDFLLGKMANKDEVAIYDAIMCTSKSMDHNGRVIDSAEKEIDDESLRDKVVSCIKYNTELVVTNTADVIRSSYNVTEMSPGDISRIINDVYEERNKAEQLIQNTSDGDVRNMLEKYKEVYTQLAAYVILWEK